MSRLSPEQIWPPFALRIAAGDLQLAVVREGDLPELVELVLDGIHDPAEMPFLFPWTDAPAAELPATEPPVAEPPLTEPPVIEPPVTQTPDTDPPALIPEAIPPATDPPVTGPPALGTPSLLSAVRPLMLASTGVEAENTGLLALLLFLAGAAVLVAVRRRGLKSAPLTTPRPAHHRHAANRTPGGRRVWAHRTHVVARTGIRQRH